jgi:F0F1-type ATP synthase assembly protein I
MKRESQVKTYCTGLLVLTVPAEHYKLPLLCFGHLGIRLWRDSRATMASHNKKKRIWTANVAIVMQLGLTMVGCILFCFYIGRLLDRWLETRALLTVIMTLVGIIGGANVAYRQIMEVTEDNRRDYRGENNNHGSD